MGPQDLSVLLWRERELLDVLLFKLEEEQMILATGKTHWLHLASQEVQQVHQRISTIVLEVDVASCAVAESWDLPAGLQLRELAAQAPDPTWRAILESHHAALSAQIARATELRSANDEFIRAASRSVQETLANYSGPNAATYDAKGHSTNGAQARLLDQSV